MESSIVGLKGPPPTLCAMSAAPSAPRLLPVPLWANGPPLPHPLCPYITHLGWAPSSSSVITSHPTVMLPPEKAEGREGPGQLFSVDDGERATGREGPRGPGKKSLNIDVGLSPSTPTWCVPGAQDGQRWPCVGDCGLSSLMISCSSASSRY